MPVALKPGVKTPKSFLNRRSLTLASQAYIGTIPWGNGENAFSDWSIVDLEAYYDLDEPLLRRANTFWLLAAHTIATCPSRSLEYRVTVIQRLVFR